VNCLPRTNIDTFVVEDGIDVRNEGGLVLVDVEGPRFGQIPNADLGDNTPSGGGRGHLARRIDRRSPEAAHDNIVWKNDEKGLSGLLE
jgi:hypothetical protein